MKDGVLEHKGSKRWESDEHVAETSAELFGRNKWCEQLRVVRWKYNDDFFDGKSASWKNFDNYWTGWGQEVENRKRHLRSRRF